MPTLIVCASKEHGNTREVAEAIAGVLDCDVVAPEEFDPERIGDHDRIGFGSGIRFGKPYRELLELIDRIPEQTGRRAFIFSTSGFGWLWWHSTLRKRLEAKGFTLHGEYCCKALDTMGMLRLFGGVNKGRPNDEDLADARRFASKLQAPE